MVPERHNRKCICVQTMFWASFYKVTVIIVGHTSSPSPPNEIEILFCWIQPMTLLFEFVYFGSALYYCLMIVDYIIALAAISFVSSEWYWVGDKPPGWIAKGLGEHWDGKY